MRQLGQILLLSWTPVAMNQGPGLFNQYQNAYFISIYHHTMFEPSQFINVQMHATIEGFFCLFFKCTPKQQLLSLITQISLWHSIKIFNLNCLTRQISSDERVYQKLKTMDMLSTGLVTPVKVTENGIQCHKVNGENNHGRKEKN